MRQISVFLENLSGRLADVTRALAVRGVNLRALTIADTADFGILRLIADDTDTAVAVLEAQGLPVRVTDVLGVEVPDAPGALADVMDAFRSAGVNIEYLYSTLEGAGAAVILKVADLARGQAIVRDRGWGLLESL
jgi:hypothetical protein